MALLLHFPAPKNGDRTEEADLRTGLLALQWRAERSGAVKLGKSRFRSGDGKV